MQKTIEIFEQRNKDKQDIEFTNKKRKRVKVGEIWIGKVGVNIGSEISKDGTFQRPFVVVAEHLGGDLVGVLPMTTKYHERYSQFYVKIEHHEEYGLNKPSYIVLNQFKIVSMKRLQRKINNIHAKGSYKKTLPIPFIQKLIDSVFAIIKNPTNKGSGGGILDTTNVI